MIKTRLKINMSVERVSENNGGGREGATAASRRRRGQAGQSAIVAIIVLFLLLFLTGIFIAIISNNIRGTSVSARVTQADRFANAGITYLDEQLTKSPEGADWRPVPDCAFGALCTAVAATDPDFTWLKPCADVTGPGGVPDGVNDAEPCGYTRVNFGSDIAGGRERGPAVGGRALVRVTYQPNATDPLSRYIRLDSIGRVGQIDPRDPTTYARTQALGQKVERFAYKSIGLNEYVRQITNKDNKPGTVVLGAQSPVRDRDANGNPVTRNIESVYVGPIRVNAPLTFYGINRILLDPARNQALEVVGNISLNNVNDAASTLGTGDATQVYVSFLKKDGMPYTSPVPNLFPSGSPNFTTLARLVSQQNLDVGFALVRDNPRGSETGILPPDPDEYGNQFQNLRVAGRLDPPIIDAVTGADGLTRYRALTRDSAPLPNIRKKDDPYYTTGTGDDLKNQIGAAIYSNAGFYGWGQGMYIDNNNDVQSTSTTLIGGYSLRNDWLNPSSKSGYWRGDFEYVPPATTIVLTPRGFTVELSPYNQGRQAYYFRDPRTGERFRSGVNKIYRYTPLPTDTTGVKPASVGPTAGMLDSAKYAGYPATNFGRDGIPKTPDDTPYYEGDFVIHLEGNVRIRGAAGGIDPETKNLFIRHVTVVTNGTAYVDGNLLRDNITAELVANPPTGVNSTTLRSVHGRSTIALLAKNYIAVNTTQFTNPQDSQSFLDQTAIGVELNAGKQTYSVNANFGPVFDPTNGFSTPGYLLNAGPTADATRHPFLLLRHTAGGDTTRPPLDAFLNAFLNQKAPDVTNPTGDNALLFTPTIPGQLAVTEPNLLPLGPSVGLSPATFAYDRFDLRYEALLRLANYPYIDPEKPVGDPLVGFDNRLTLRFDANANVPGTTPGGTYLTTRVGIVPMDIRIETLMYAQEGSFFIIPGPWFNPNPNDTIENYLAIDPDDNQPRHRRDGEVTLEDRTGKPQRRRTDSRFPFYRQPMDIRITFCGSITENLPAEIADQGAWLEKWGWVPEFYGSTGLPNLRANYPTQDAKLSTVHGPSGSYPGGDAAGNGKGNGLVFEFDPRSVWPYAPMYSGATAMGYPLRPNPYNPVQPLPFAPRLPVAPGLLYSGGSTEPISQ